MISGGIGAVGAADDGGPPLAIGLFCPAWPPERFANGIITYVASVAEGMRELGHRPYLLAAGLAEGEGPPCEPGLVDLKPISRATGAGRLAEAAAARFRPPSPDSGIRRVARGLRRAARGGVLGLPRLDVLEVEETLGLPGFVAGRGAPPVIARLHGPWFLNGPNQGADPASPEFARRVRAEGDGIAASRAVTSPSADTLRRTRERYGLALGQAEAIPNPVLLVPEGRRWRPEEAEPGHVLFVGRFDRHKGGDTIIDAFALLLRDRPDARLTFVGPDPGLDRDGRRWSLPEYASTRLPGALEDGRVRWLGRRTPAEVSALRGRASATVVASRYETFAITITEAMAAGCPLVATRAGGAGELFEHEEHGLYAEPDDPVGLASAISRLLADPSAASAMGRRAAGHCERRYAPAVVARQTIRFYRRVLSGRAGGDRR
ncbi:Glycogen synthase (plasmid) [Tautonia plasticadhaerens]|uniref:Glycogen synthase n=2 Tax=Tautonia plasticadhaerens TaxID=2527974 RepID=A0A518HFM0_9BACT|nr:Glycogen synthase [Tautonia plasticadhaerens]